MGRGNDPSGIVMMMMSSAVLVLVTLTMMIWALVRPRQCSFISRRVD